MCVCVCVAVCAIVCMQISATFVFLNLVWYLAFVMCHDNMCLNVCVCVCVCVSALLRGPVCDHNCVQNNNEHLRLDCVCVFVCVCLCQGLVLPY